MQRPFPAVSIMLFCSTSRGVVFMFLVVLMCIINCNDSVCASGGPAGGKAHPQPAFKEVPFQQLCWAENRYITKIRDGTALRRGGEFD